MFLDIFQSWIKRGGRQQQAAYYNGLATNIAKSTEIKIISQVLSFLGYSWMFFEAG